jgi:histidine triad (HIT) family protein
MIGQSTHVRANVPGRELRRAVQPRRVHQTPGHDTMPPPIHPREVSMPIEMPQRDRCPFCNLVAGTSTFAVVEELDDTMAWLPPRQSGLGHVLIIPKRHASTILDLDPTEAVAIMRHVHRVATAISAALDPAGLNIFQNNGLTAGQTVPHYHVHIVPSYPGDEAGRIFRSEDHERVSHEELLATAAKIASHLPPA